MLEYVPVSELVEVIFGVGVEEQIQGFAIEAVCGVAFEFCKLLVAVPAHYGHVFAVVLEVEKQLCHVESVRHKAQIHVGASQLVVSQMLKGIFHKVELCKRTWNGSARVFVETSVGVFDLSDFVGRVGRRRNPVGVARIGVFVAI